MPDPVVEPGAASGEKEKTEIDLTSPAFLAAAGKLADEKLEKAQKAWEADVKGLKDNKEELLRDLTAFKAFGKPEDLAAKLKALDEADLTKKAGEHGVPKEKYEADVESAAQKKFEVHRQENADILGRKDATIAELTAAKDQAEARAHRLWVEGELIRSLIPAGAQVVHPGAWDQLGDAMKGAIVAQPIEGVDKPVARVKIAGTFMAGGGSDGLMTPAELLQKTRLGQGPFGRFDFCFLSNGQGSDTADPKGSTFIPGKLWENMNDAEQAAAWGTDPKKAKEMVDASLMRKQSKRAA